jgi:hypothetical protein
LRGGSVERGRFVALAGCARGLEQEQRHRKQDGGTRPVAQAQEKPGEPGVLRIERAQDVGSHQRDGHDVRGKPDGALDGGEEVDAAEAEPDGERRVRQQRGRVPLSGSKLVESKEQEHWPERGEPQEELAVSHAIGAACESDERYEQDRRQCGKRHVPLALVESEVIALRVVGRIAAEVEPAV